MAKQGWQKGPNFDQYGLEHIIAAGENPYGATSITPNGVARSEGEGHNQEWRYGGTDGPRFNGSVGCHDAPEAPTGTVEAKSSPGYYGPKPWGGNMTGQ